MPIKFQVLHKNSSIFVAGHRGLVGSSIVRRLKELGFSNLILKDKSELNLLNQKEVSCFFSCHQIDYVIMAAAKCGGIGDNGHYPADYFYENAMMALNVIQNSLKTHVKKLLYLGSSCLYPKDLSGQIQERDLLSGPLETTNLSYSIAKISGIEFCRAIYKQYSRCFISVMPTNIYGPGDNFSSSGSHVIPALIRKVHEAQKDGKRHIEIWGTGKPLRNFLYVDDLAAALLITLDRYNHIEPINIGHNDNISISDLALLVCDAMGIKMRFKYDLSKPDGTFRKSLCLNKINQLGFKPKIKLFTGIQNTYKWALDNNILN
ncbi:MAG: GDP-L-fucose synthase [Bacteriovoracales bacterium]|nr:GDP-L-fucose synthase [Bacteriovoracales bacterium]